MSREELIEKIKQKKAVIGIIGLGYVGLPLLLNFSRRGFTVIGLDVDRSKVKKFNQGQSYIKHISESDIKEAVKNKASATVDFSKIADVDAVIICVPTPLNKHREPDISYVEETIHSIGKYFRAGQILSLESTIYPGSTTEYLKPEVEKRGMTLGEDFFLVYSPEREDPGNVHFEVSSIPKIVGGETPGCRDVGEALYGEVVEKTVPVSSTKVAEFAKLLENIHRAVNIGLVNEMKVVADRMGIDIYEVIDAAATKPFGFVPYYPGPGIGGHCIPIDPFYLTWKAREFGIHTRFIELAGEINDSMPEYVVNKTFHALNAKKKPINGSKVLILGIAYKPDVDDMRESPALRVMELLEERGAEICYHDPNITQFSHLRKYNFNLSSKPLTQELLKEVDAAIIVTNNKEVDYDLVRNFSDLIIDTRGIYKGVHSNVIRA